MNLEQTVTGWFHHDTKESTMTTTAPEANPTAAAPAPSAQPPSFWGMLHGNLSRFDASVVHFLPKLEQIATNPRLDALIEAALSAAGAGVAEEVFVGAVDMLTAAARHKQDTQAPPAPADGTTDTAATAQQGGM